MLRELLRLGRRADPAPVPPPGPSREEIGLDLIHACDSFDVVLTRAAQVAVGLPLDTEPEFVPLPDVLERARTGGFITDSEVADWRLALRVRIDYLSEQRPPTHEIAEAVAVFRRLEADVRARLGGDAPPPLPRYEPRPPL